MAREALITNQFDRFFRNLPHPISSLGTLSNQSNDEPHVFFVDSGHAAARTTNDGHDPDLPISTIRAAIGKCTASRGDIILVAPGHAETLSAVCTVDKIGISIIGVGEGALRPAITVSYAGDGFDVTAASVTIENLRFPTVGNAAAIPINIAANRATIRGCVFEMGANCVDEITLTAAAELPTFEDNEVIVAANGADSWLKFEGVIDRPVIRRNSIIGSDGTNAFDDGCFDFNSVAVTNPQIYDNNFSGGGTATTIVANGGSVVAAQYGPNRYAGSATDADNISGGAANLSAITDQLSGTTGIASFPNAAVPANNVSLAEVMRDIWGALQGTAAGENGVQTFPAAAAPANNVSLAEVIRSIYDRQVGNATTCAVNTRLGTRVNRSTADVITGSNVPIFTVATGRVLLTALSGKVTTVIGAGASNAKFQFNPTTGTTVDMCANLDIDADEAGTLYSITGVPGDAMLTSQSGAVRTFATPIILDIGDIEFLGGTDRTGSISFQAWYIPLDDGATLAAA